MKKYLIIALVLFFASCKTYVIPFHLTTDKISKIKPGMDKTKVLENFGIYPSEIFIGWDNGCEIHQYFYWKDGRELRKSLVPKPKGLKAGDQVFFKNSDKKLYVFYRNEKVELVITEDGLKNYKEIKSQFLSDSILCAGESEIYGCMDPQSLNYNPDATDDNGSCKYCECGFTQNPNYNPKRPTSECNSPCIKIQDKQVNAPQPKKCDLCDLVANAKNGDKINLNVNVSMDNGGNVNAPVVSESKHTSWVFNIFRNPFRNQRIHKQRH
jgi:hypothetical protein